MFAITTKSFHTDTTYSPLDCHIIEFPDPQEYFACLKLRILIKAMQSPQVTFHHRCLFNFEQRSNNETSLNNTGSSRFRYFHRYAVRV